MNASLYSSAMEDGSCRRKSQSRLDTCLLHLLYQDNSLLHQASELLFPGPFYDSYDASAQQQIVPNLFLTHPLFSNLNGKNLCVHNQSELFGLEEPYASNPLSPWFSSSYLYPEAALTGSFGLRNGLRSSPKMQEYQLQRFAIITAGDIVGMGTIVEYFHSQDISDGISQLHGSDINETVNEDHAFAPGAFREVRNGDKGTIESEEGDTYLYSLIANAVSGKIQ
ncbi:hypothetical protein J5N97_001466 [Dioscorea zingiberensis]|uniref:Uncharacterized protein n=1 Tax=Dioscorea zingiberensis TaxID=325984 RepID=A0A9D5BTY2_9LILI|nr:hypothetical protein J5N97_001466 [Dioscorea zingiberensis]